MGTLHTTCVELRKMDGVGGSAPKRHCSSVELTKPVPVIISCTLVSGPTPSIGFMSAGPLKRVRLVTDHAFSHAYTI